MAIALKLVERDKASSVPRKQKPKEKEPFLRDEDRSAAGGLPVTSVGNGRRILIVDDNVVVLKAFEMKLKAHGFAVTTTASSEAVATAIEGSRAEIVILDINFPPAGGIEWNGFTIIQWLRRFPDLASVPVILITAADSLHYRAKAAAAGAVALFEKPVDFRQLLAAILGALGAPAAVPPAGTVASAEIPIGQRASADLPPASSPGAIIQTS